MPDYRAKPLCENIGSYFMSVTVPDQSVDWTLLKSILDFFVGTGRLVVPGIVDVTAAETIAIINEDDRGGCCLLAMLWDLVHGGRNRSLNHDIPGR